MSWMRWPSIVTRVTQWIGSSKLAQVAGFYAEADNVSHVVAHKVPEAAMTMFYTGLLDAMEKTGRGQFPAVVLFFFNAGCMVHF